MRLLQSRLLSPWFLFGAALLGFWLYFRSLVATLEFDDASIQGFLLVPSLPTPLYLVMATVVLAGVGLTLWVSVRQRRRHQAPPDPQRQEEATRTPLQAVVSLLASLTLFALLMAWLVRHGTEVQHLLDRLRSELGAMHEWLESAQTLVQQMPSPTTGYALFVVVLVVYGGLTVLALWVLLEDRHRVRFQPPGAEDQHTRLVRRAVRAGLRELQEHADPRQAIIACYARLEHLLEDYGVPAAAHLTPQEYMSSALHGLELPEQWLTPLVSLFEEARYSLHPLAETDRTAALTCLQRLQQHLEGDPAYATPG